MNLTKTALTIGSALGVRELIDSVENLELDDILNIVGLERRPTSIARLLPAIGLITVSAAVGAGAALLLAPSSGTKLRARLSDGIDETKHRITDKISEIENKRGRHAVS